ncbi:MAG: AAA family ATPase [Gemmatimonadales bacterium]
MPDQPKTWADDPTLAPWRFDLDAKQSVVAVPAATPAVPPADPPDEPEPSAEPARADQPGPPAEVSPQERLDIAGPAAPAAPAPDDRQDRMAVAVSPPPPPPPQFASFGWPPPEQVADAAVAPPVSAATAAVLPLRLLPPPAAPEPRAAGGATSAQPDRPESAPPAASERAPQPLPPREPAPVPAGPPAAAHPANLSGPVVGFDGYLRGQITHPAPRQGWRALLWRASAGRLSVGASARELADRAARDRIRTPLGGWHTVTVASSKGGVGKTTTSALLGLTLAEHRGDRVVALDANPDAGNLAQRLLGHRAPATVRQLLEREDLDQLTSFTDVSRFVNSAGRLQLLASDLDPAMSEAFSRDEYRRVLSLLTRFFNIVITDSGTGLIHSAMDGALESTRSLIVTGAPTIDAAEHIDTTLNWLVAHGFDELVHDAIIVLTCDRRARGVDPAALRTHFGQRCRAVVELPRDPHLTEGGRIDLEALRPRTRAAARELAGLVAEAFVWDYPTPSGFAAEGRSLWD